MAMSIETVKKAEKLIEERGQIVAATWTHVAGLGSESGISTGWNYTAGTPADEQLRQAIEEFRKRKLDAIDAELRELGVDPSEQDSGASRPRRIGTHAGMQNASQPPKGDPRG